MTARVLVVDDHAANLKLACDVLEWEGFQVDRARDAEEALERIRLNPPDLILMDIELPQMDGLALTRKLKADPATRHIRVVALTAYAMKGDEQKAREAGCDGYLTKPISTRLLGEQVRAALNPNPEAAAPDAEGCRE
ncbi:MAG: response regulator [Candidatus Eremiobacterota bacterium]